MVFIVLMAANYGKELVSLNNFGSIKLIVRLPESIDKISEISWHTVKKLHDKKIIASDDRNRH